MEKETLETMAKAQMGSLNFIAKDMATLARMLKKTPFEDQDHFQANLVQASFYLTAYTMATKAFNRMIDDQQRDPSSVRKAHDYFLDEAVDMQTTGVKEEEGEEENDD